MGAVSAAEERRPWRAGTVRACAPCDSFFRGVADSDEVMAAPDGCVAWLCGAGGGCWRAPASAMAGPRPTVGAEVDSAAAVVVKWWLAALVQLWPSEQHGALCG